jgi:hypothetical protein
VNSFVQTEDVSFEQVLVLAQRLRPIDQARLAARLVPALETVLDQVNQSNSTAVRKPLRGMLADLGKAPSSEEINDVQRTMWASFNEK